MKNYIKHLKCTNLCDLANEKNFSFGFTLLVATIKTWISNVCIYGKFKDAGIHRMHATCKNWYNIQSRILVIICGKWCKSVLAHYSTCILEHMNLHKSYVLSIAANLWDSLCWVMLNIPFKWWMHFDLKQADYPLKFSAYIWKLLTYIPDLNWIY